MSTDDLHLTDTAITSIRAMLCVGFPVHDDPLLAGDRRPDTHGRPPIDAFPAWMVGSFGGIILGWL